MLKATTTVSWRSVVTTLLLVAVAASGCSSSSQGNSRGTPSPSTSSLSPAAKAKQDAVTAYRGMWTAFTKAAATANPDEPDLRRYAQGDALKAIVSGLYTDRTQGEVGRGAPLITPTATDVQPANAPTSVAISDCVDARNWLLYYKSGGLVDKTPGGKHRTTATVTRANGTWKVNTFALEGSGTC